MLPADESPGTTSPTSAGTFSGTTKFGQCYAGHVGFAFTRLCVSAGIRKYALIPRNAWQATKQSVRIAADREGIPCVARVRFERLAVESCRLRDVRTRNPTPPRAGGCDQTRSVVGIRIDRTSCVEFERGSTPRPGQKRELLVAKGAAELTSHFRSSTSNGL